MSSNGEPKSDPRVTAARRGDVDALEALLKTCSPSLRRRLTLDRVWQSTLDVDDVLQVTYLEVFLRASEMRAESLGDFHAWVARIATNNLTDAVRALSREKRPSPSRRIMRDDAGDSHSVLLEHLVATSHTASRSVVRREAREILMDAIRSLPKSYRHVVPVLPTGAS